MFIITLLCYYDIKVAYIAKSQRVKSNKKKQGGSHETNPLVGLAPWKTGE